ncbi:MAG: DNA-binding protein [Betaproteobacteria bacterium]|nr:DNA-binding protein [Betaproteobacteria bacterium]
MLLVDTNVLLDVVTNDPKWAAWSQSRLDAAALTQTVAINDVIYAELSLAFERIEELDAMIAKAGLRHEPIPRESLFLAAKASLSYRRKGGAKGGVPPDFFIGAHAAVLDIPLLTRDTARYETYFPNLELIAPETTSR